MQGLASAVIGSAGMTWIARTQSSKHRPMALSIAQMGISLGVLSPAPAAFVSYALGPSSPFFILAGLMLLDCAAAVAVMTNDVPGVDTEPDEEPRFWSQLQDSHIACLNVLIGMSTCIIGFLQPIIGPYAHEAFGFDIRMQGVLWFGAAASFLATRPIAPLLCARVSGWMVVTGGAGLCATALALLAVPSPVFIICGMCGVGGGNGFVVTPAIPLLADIVELPDCPYGYGTVFSLVDATSAVGFLVGPFISTVPLSFKTKALGALLTSVITVCCAVHLRTIEDRKASKNE
uniref:Major facilitator superfamily (MFS) profile domain-containing protein n=1 Tax=Eutreptiella gymnastica TaxID=73025 RepID=A0A7S4FSH2_9EUGL